jgi:hypothetical protein
MTQDNDSWDAWEHMYECEDNNIGGYQKIKAPKIKKLKKEKDFHNKKKKR